jgi:hypothetical protein
VEKNEVLLENLKADIWSKVSQPTYGPKLGCMVQSVTKDFIFTSRLIAHVFLIQELFW